MNMICKMFGHQPAFGWYRKPGGGYFDIKYDSTDGLGIVHATLHCNCERCGEKYQVGMVHVPDPKKLLVPLTTPRLAGIK